jgi:hypothetical protein
MAVRHRAMQAEDKRERRDAILDAAKRVLAGAPERFASVAEVADERRTDVEAVRTGLWAAHLL